MNFADLPEVKAALESMAALDAKVEQRYFAYEVGKKLQLEVEVTDPLIARVILWNELGNNPLMPGMKITGVRFSDLARKDVVIAWMEAQIAELKGPEAMRIPT